MRKSIRLIVALLAGSSLGLVLLAGCSKPREDQAGQDLLQAVGLARRHSERALSLMANLTYQAGGEAGPIQGRKVTSQEVMVLPLDAVNPKALEALTEARKVLTDALSADADAPAANLALANQMLAQVESLMGDYSLAQARSARRGVLSGLETCQAQANSIASGTALMKQYEALAASDDQQLNNEITQAAGDAQKAQADLTAAETETADLVKQVDGLTTANKRLLADAAGLRTQSQATKDEKQLEQFDEAIKKEIEAGNNGAKIFQLERKIGLLKADASTAKLVITSAQARQDMARKLLEDRKNTQTALTGEKTKVVDQVAKYGKSLEAASGELAAKVAEACTSQAEAGAHYQAALNACKEAARKDPASRGALAGQAAAAQSIALANTALLEVNNPLALFAESVERTYKELNQSAPPAMTKIKGLLVDAGKARQDAADKFQEAAQSYQRVITMLASDPQTRKWQWAYQAQRAGALINVANHTTKADERADALKNAEQMLADALQKKENSPYLQEALRLRQQLSGAGQAPSSSPAVPTSAPAAPAAG